MLNVYLQTLNKGVYVGVCIRKMKFQWNSLYKNRKRKKKWQNEKAKSVGCKTNKKILNRISLCCFFFVIDNDKVCTLYTQVKVQIYVRLINLE